jgi:hypothetical protein
MDEILGVTGVAGVQELQNKKEACLGTDFLRWCFQRIQKSLYKPETNTGSESMPKRRKYRNTVPFCNS